ncbi:MAG: hypothetical protein C6W57_14700 [Caldibacillus debilis]|nr:MAG: hypothetical protein C6W57_14700 [Caldibacillus debilis]
MAEHRTAGEKSLRPAAGFPSPHPLRDSQALIRRRISRACCVRFPKREFNFATKDYSPSSTRTAD